MSSAAASINSGNCEVRRSLTVEARRTLATAFVATQVNYCNAVFYGVTTQVTCRLRMVLNAAARLVVGTGKFDCITPVLRDILHWLPVPQRIQFKGASATYDCVHGTGPAYFKDVCTLVIDIADRSNLRSAQYGDMFVPRTRTEFGRRSFHMAAPAVWNALPSHLRSTTISCGQFRAGLKTYLFNLAFYTDSL